jgi:NAD(P)H-flavin reductase
MAKPGQVAIFTHKNTTGKSVSFFGDMHPSFNGSVVKAMASAKQGYPLISKELNTFHSNHDPDFFQKLDALFTAKIHQVNRLTDTIVEVIVKAPWAAKQFQPGQFFRLQNYESLAPRIGNTKLTLEGLALTGAWADPDKELLSTVVLEMGASSRLCAFLKPGEPVVLMGPTGTPTEIPEQETVVLAGGGLGNAVLFSIGQAMRKKGCTVLYFAAYKKPQDQFMIDRIEAAADQVIWCCDTAKIHPNRPQDRTFNGTIVQAMIHYKDLLKGADRLITIGSAPMMAAVNHARHTVLKDTFKPNLKAIASINSPMQCMMKEICGQCIQRHVDPKTGKESYVFSCMNQDQNMNTVDFGMLSNRLQQNSVQEKLTNFWLMKSLNKIIF